MKRYRRVAHSRKEASPQRRRTIPAFARAGKNDRGPQGRIPLGHHDGERTSERGPDDRKIARVYQRILAQEGESGEGGQPEGCEFTRHD